MSQRKLRDLPHPLTLPKLLGSAGNWKPPGISHELKEVKRSHRAVEQQTRSLSSPSGVEGGSPGGGWASVLSLAFQLWAILSLQLPSWCCC